MAKFVLKPQQILTAGDMSANIIVECPTIQQADLACIQINYSGASPAGTLIVEASLDDINWVALPLTVNGSTVMSLVIPTATSPIMVDLYSPGAPHIRVNFTASGGSVGTANILFTYKRLGE